MLGSLDPMNRKQIISDLSLLMITVIWGFTFIIVHDALSNIETFNFLWLRFGFAFLSSSIVFHKRIFNKMNKATIFYGSLIGIILFFAYGFQTLGLVFTTPSNSGFITGLYVIFVPLFAALLFKYKLKKENILGVILAVTGLILISFRDDFQVNIGDILTLFCAFSFAFHILTIDKWTKKVDSICLATIQIGTVSFISFFVSIFFENTYIPNFQMKSVWYAIIITAIFATTLAFIIQNIAQRHTNPTHTALIYTAEPVFAGIFAVLLTDDVFTLRSLIGSGLILSGMLISKIRILKFPKNIPLFLGLGIFQGYNSKNK